MLKRPAFRNCFRVETVPSEGAFLLSEFGHVVLPDRMHELVAPMIDSRRTADAIAEELAGEAPPEHVYYTLLDLEQRGLIVDAELAGSIWSYLGADPRAARARVEASAVEVLAAPGLDPEPLVSALRAHGLRDSPQADFTLVLTADPLDPELQRINAEALSQERPWMLVNPFAATALLGPIFKPGETGCWECLAARLRANRDVEAYLEAKGKKGPFRADTAALSALAPAATALAAFQAARFVALGQNPDLVGRVVSFELSSMSTTTHHLVRRPQCPACGDAGYLSRALAPVQMEPRPKRFRADGGHRTASPAETFARYQHHVSPLTGVVSGLSAAPVPGGGPLHVYIAGHNFAMKADSLHFLRQHLRVKSSGKGMSDVQARTSALCEAIERCSGLFSADRPRRWASLEELGEAGIHPNRCMGFSERQYATRRPPAELGSPFHAVPLPFDPAARIDWTPVWSFRSNSFRYLPTSYCYYGYPS
ncbi:MAG TPA: TOMM precursor leader peptide-binding protein, partial [Candidatus Nanopelagicales bacterium]|nr:TOMM precursor leader peptide-binding protein [Candidatus Nanopelagicales bacterium]